MRHDDAPEDDTDIPRGGEPVSPAAALATPAARFGALSFAYFGSIGLFNPYAPLWFQSLGFSTVAIGAIASLQAWTRVLTPYAWSWSGDHSGRRVELIRLAAAGSLLSALGLFGVRAAVPVALVTALLFVFNGGVIPLFEAALARLVGSPGGAGGIDPTRYGRIRVWGSVGFVVSVSGFGALLERTGIQVFPAFVAAMNGLMLLAALRLPVAREDVRHDEPAPPVLPLLRRPALAWLFASMAFTVLAHTALYAFFSLYLVALGYGKTAVGGFWTLSIAVEIVFFWMQGRVFPLFSPHRWLEIVALVTAVRFAVTAGGAAWAPALVLAQLLHVVTFACHHAACIALVHRYFPGRLRGRGQALYTMLGYGAPGVLGGVAGGWLIEGFGYAAVFWAAAGGGLVAWDCARRARLAAPD